MIGFFFSSFSGGFIKLKSPVLRLEQVIMFLNLKNSFNPEIDAYKNLNFDPANLIHLRASRRAICVGRVLSGQSPIQQTRILFSKFIIILHFRWLESMITLEGISGQPFETTLSPRLGARYRIKTRELGNRCFSADATVLTEKP